MRTKDCFESVENRRCYRSSKSWEHVHVVPPRFEHARAARVVQDKILAIYPRRMLPALRSLFPDQSKRNESVCVTSKNVMCRRAIEREFCDATASPGFYFWLYATVKERERDGKKIKNAKEKA